MAVFEYGAADPDNGQDQQQEYMKVTRQNSSRRITIPSDIAAELEIDYGDHVSVKQQGDSIVIKPL